MLGLAKYLPEFVYRDKINVRKIPKELWSIYGHIIHVVL